MITILLLWLALIIIGFCFAAIGSGHNEPSLLFPVGIAMIIVSIIWAAISVYKSAPLMFPQ